MDKWLKTGTLKRSASRTEIRNTDLAAMEITVDQQDDNHELQRPTDWPVQVRNKIDFVKKNISSPQKKRKYSNKYLKYGFPVTGDECGPKPLCVVCGEILSNGSMKPSLLMRHLETKHPTYKQRNVNFFQRLSNSPNLNSCLISTNKTNEAAIETSYRISYHIAKSGKNHTIAENLVFPCIKDAVECMFGKDHVQKIKNILLSNSTVSRRIENMSIDVEATINERIKKSPFFSIQVDESTDVSDLSILLVIARYLNVNELEENLLLCYTLIKICTVEDIFNAVQGYFYENEMDWAKCSGVCTDGGKSMPGCYKGLLVVSK
ncbi:Zinc finger BED domain-containing protein 5 [Araneus ventricosus]|uniref:Zinc finger BED domain-containing protein 5 n=1 Tax=Araneus ventricosus TaxID=182803 RepID=A0A4Y2EZ61_ARAVE|nr:Zinc finger BED domain-containing protein 5 [Araneus ventricosus]